MLIKSDVYVAQGLGLPRPGTAHVVAVCDRNGKPQVEEQNFLYDVDLGWVYYEVKHEVPSVRVWSVKGYSEVRSITPPAPPPGTPVQPR